MMMEMKEKAMAVAAALEDKKALDIRVLSVENLTSLTDCFVIASAASASQLDAMADAVDEALSKRGEPPRKKEGTPQSGWVLLDLENVMVHLFHQEKRSFYQMERLWADGVTLPLPEQKEEK